MGGMLVLLGVLYECSWEGGRRWWVVDLDSQENLVSLDVLMRVLNVYTSEVGCLIPIILAPYAITAVLRQF